MKKRIEYIDVLRGIGIIYMVMGHIFGNKGFDYYIHAFHMPLFFFVSGLFFKQSKDMKFKDFFNKVTKQLLVPYLLFGLFYVAFACVTSYGLKENFLVTLLQVITINNNGFPIAVALWFLTAMYFAQLFFFILCKLFKSDWSLGISSCLILLLGIYFQKLFGFRLWWSLDPAFVGVGLLFLGYKVGKLNKLDNLPVPNIAIIILLFIVNYFMIKYTGYVNMRTGVYPFVLFFLINFLFSQYVYISFSKWILNKKIVSWLVDKVMMIGKYSIIYLCLNQFILLIVDKIITMFIKINLIANSITTIITLVIIYIISLIIFQTKLKVLFGK